jgi:hypothetical protein
MQHLEFPQCGLSKDYQRYVENFSVQSFYTDTFFQVNIPGDIQIKRYLDRLTRKHEAVGNSKRANAYPIAYSNTPTLPNSFALNQDGTDFSYFAEVKFGSNLKSLWMLMDTGASSTWVMGSDCTSAACKIHNTFGESDSKTLKSLSDDFSIGYGTGEVSGTWASDSLSFAGLQLTLNFGIANTTSDDFTNFPFDGIMGLATNAGDYPPAFAAMTDAKILKANLFGVNLDRRADGTHDGEINWGVIDVSKFTGAVGYNPLSVDDGGWGIKGDGASVGGKQSGISTAAAYIDTGTSYVFIPEADALALHSLIPGATRATDGGPSWQIPCDTTSDIEFVFNGISYGIPSVDWVGGKNGLSDLCTSNIYAGEPVGAGNWLLGDTFMKNVYTIFDLDQKRIGKYPLKHLIRLFIDMCTGFGNKTTASSTTPLSTSSSVSNPSSSSTGMQLLFLFTSPTL